MPTVFPKPDHIQQLIDKKARFALRAGLFSRLRRFFEEHGFIEVMTPVRIQAPAPEEFIEAPPSGTKFLRCSPELEMKRLLCAGYEKIYQIGSCFRSGENGRRHREEFTMLEWYETGSDYLKLMDFTTAMLRYALKNENLSSEIITVDEAYRKFAATTAEKAIADDCFDELMVEKIEPNLGCGKLTYLIDYPASRASLARLKSNNPAVAERWELYINGLELANAYGELTDSAIQRNRFAHEQAARAVSGGAAYPFPEEFLEALDYGMPSCAGCALGLDRLAMIFTGAADIAEVVFE